MNEPAFSVIRTTRTAIEADLLIASLRSAGFHPSDLDTTPHFSLAGVDVSYHIEVPTAESSAAREFLRSHDSASSSAG
jgi:hypothetical protein